MLDREPGGVQASRIERVPLAEGLVELAQQASYLVELPIHYGGSQRLRVPPVGCVESGLAHWSAELR